MLTGALAPATHAMQRTEHSVTDNLERLSAEMVREAAHHHRWSQATAKRQIRALLAAACEEHSATCARSGGDDKGSGCSRTCS